MNHIRFSGRIHGHRLRPGTYLIRARSGKKTVFRKTLVVGSARPGNSCDGAAGTSFANSPGAAVTAAAHGGSNQSAGKSDNAAIGRPRQSGVLGVHATKVLPGSGGTQLALLIVLAAAIFLLGLGALPRQVIPHPAAAAFLVRRRTVVATAGFAALAAFLVSYFVA